MKTYQQFVNIFIIAVLFFSACASVKPGDDSNDQKLAEKVVENYHRLYNDNNYEEIYNTAHEDAKASKSKEALGLVLAQSLEKSGKHLSSELVYSKVTIINPKERQVELAYQSKFEKGARNETFLIITNDEKGALHSIGELTDDELKKLK
jgi:hypothetical protein